MDPLTHMAAGAITGKALLEKAEGRKAIVIGAIAAALPDLDLLPNYFMGPLFRIANHRGLTHSILFIIVLSIAGGFAIKRIPGSKSPSPPWKWALVLGLSLGSHLFLDCVTPYGTQLFLPFSNMRVAWNIMSIFDPVFFLPLWVGAVLLFVPGKKIRAVNMASIGCIAFSAFYLFFALGNKYYITRHFRQNLTEQQYMFDEFITVPTFINNILWRGVARRGDDYLVGYYSLFDCGADINFRHVPGDHGLIGPYTNTPAVKMLRWFSGGYYRTIKKDNCLLFCDLRYGTADISRDDSGYIMTYELVPPESGSGDMSLKVLRTARLSGSSISKLFVRIMGLSDRGLD